MSVTVYNFSSPTCAPCKAIKNTMSMIQEEFETFNWVHVNTHDDKEGYSSVYSITMVPTTVVVCHDAAGNVISQESHTGTNFAGYYRILRNALRHNC